MTLASPTSASTIVPIGRTSCLRLGVLVSGRGSNLQVLLDASAAGMIPARVVAVASNHANTLALERAQRADIPGQAFTRDGYPTRLEQDQAIADYLKAQETELVVLAGYDRVLRPPVLEAFPGRIINIHPSLLPAFAGTLHAQAEALEYGVKIAGCSVHFVTEDLDAGPILLQRTVAVDDDDTAETLAARILVEEHRALPEAIALIASGRVQIQGRRVRLAPAT